MSQETATTSKAANNKPQSTSKQGKQGNQPVKIGDGSIGFITVSTDPIVCLQAAYKQAADAHSNANRILTDAGISGGYLSRFARGKRANEAKELLTKEQLDKLGEYDTTIRAWQAICHAIRTNG